MTVRDRPVPESSAEPRAAQSGSPRRVPLVAAWPVAVAVLCGICVLGLLVGSGDVPLSAVWPALTAPDGSPTHAAVDARLDRVLLGVLTGAGFGVAGALIQALTRNPLADPGILGVNAGASFAVAVGVLAFGISRVDQYLPFAFGGAVAATVLVYGIASQGRTVPTPVRLTLVGVAVAAVLGGLTQSLRLIDIETFDRMRFWGVGTLADRPAESLAVAGPWIAAGLVIAAFCAHPLNAVALGEDLAVTVGARVGRTRVLVVAAVTVLCGASVAVAGPIAFVGLMVPHAVRWWTGPDQRWILAFTVVLAPALLVGSDVLGRVMAAHEVDVGVVTALLGAPVLIALVRRRGASAL